nr:type VI secretion system contractile sheath large subunit [Marinibactrum halimedae]
MSVSIGRLGGTEQEDLEEDTELSPEELKRLQQLKEISDQLKIIAGISSALGTRDKPIANFAILIAELDGLIGDQLDAILHHTKFQALESAWRGVYKLIEAAPINANIKIKCLDASWREVTRDIERAADFDQSALFDLFYNREFGIAGGEPMGVVLGDYHICHRPLPDYPYDDVSTLKGIAQVAAAAFCPFICSVRPEFFGLNNFEEISNNINFQEAFRQKEYTRWHSLRELEDSRFIGLCLPQVLLREPYRQDNNRSGHLVYDEIVSGRDNQKLLWGNAAFALGSVLIREFAETGWFAHIRGVPRDHHGGGLVTQFPALHQTVDHSPLVPKIITPVLISDMLERELSEIGLICLCQCYDTAMVAFRSVPSIQLPKRFAHKGATANARLSAMLQQILCASRFAQYIKVMTRDKVGSYTSAADCRRMLQSWLNEYATGRDDLGWEMLARYPLREARVEVSEDRRSPGSYQSVIYLKPHYIVDHLVSELKLTTTLAQAAVGTGG